MSSYKLYSIALYWHKLIKEARFHIINPADAFHAPLIFVLCPNKKGNKTWKRLIIRKLLNIYINLRQKRFRLWVFHLKKMHEKGKGGKRKREKERQMDGVLIIIDMQNDYFCGGNVELSGINKAAENVRNLLDLYRNNNRPIFHLKWLRSGLNHFKSVQFIHHQRQKIIDKYK